MHEALSTVSIVISLFAYYAVFNDDEWGWATGRFRMTGS